MQEPKTLTRIKTELDAAVDKYLSLGVAEVQNNHRKKDGARNKDRIAQISGSMLLSILRKCAKDIKLPFIAAYIQYRYEWKDGKAIPHDPFVDVRIPNHKRTEILTSWLRLVSSHVTSRTPWQELEKAPCYLSNEQYTYVKHTSVYHFIINDLTIYDRWLKEVQNNPAYRAALGKPPLEE
jgi:hypothetical protein